MVNKCDSLNAGTDTVLMQWRVKPLYTSQAINPFALRGSNATYFGAEWRKDPADSNWWIGSTLLDGPDGNIIKGIGIQADSNKLQVDWVRITTKDTSSVLYFEGFTFTQGSCDSVGPLLCGRQAMDSTIILNMSPCADTSFYAQEAATYFFDIYHEKLKGEFEKAYTSKCMDAGKLETFTVTHQLMEYHYTLYYYDQAGNLIKTVPPEGVDIHRDDEWMEEVEQAREEGEVLVPDHRLATTYRYNSLNQVITQHSPDGGFSRFWYDRLGRLVISQNAQQALDGNYSYTLYDQLGRITEVGQKKQTTPMADAIARSRGDLNTWLNGIYTFDESTVVAEQVIKTVYDVRNPNTGTIPETGYVVNPAFQKSYTLRNRVSYTRYYDKLVWNGDAVVYDDYDNSTTYSYDIHGNIDTLLHHYRTGLMADDHGNNQYKAIAYRYDLISGRINEVHYQPGMADQFYHRYEYDAENKLADVFTTDRKTSMGIPALEAHEARYSYYKHGPLARTVLGQEQVQGIDYAYTMQGWLKGVNNDSLLDKDGKSGSLVAKDAYRFALNYYNGDYKAIGNAVSNVVFPGHSAFMENVNEGDYRPLYNGNISSMVVGIPQLGEVKLYNYGYDQLNRIVSMDTWRGYNSAEGVWDNDMQKLDDYKERISYDANGNIKTYFRNGYGGASHLAMNDLIYQYPKDVHGNITNNRLRYVYDEVPDNYYSEDIDKQTTLNIDVIKDEKLVEQISDNYQYDAIGNLIKNMEGKIQSIEWTVYGKVRKITKDDGSEIRYTYDVAGNRISKTVIKDGVIITTWYSRDAQGKPIAIYTGTSTSLFLSEQLIYGVNRLGIWKRNINMDVPVIENDNTFTVGNKVFELPNHLGNVLVTISDKKLGYEPMDRQFDKYRADIISANDYYPFGMMMEGRKFSALSFRYRYGFEGQFAEEDPEAGLNAFELRIYDNRIGRWLSKDPIGEFWSPYVAMGDGPTNRVDPTGGCTDCPNGKDVKPGDKWTDSNGTKWVAGEDGKWWGELGEVVVDSKKSKSFGDYLMHEPDIKGYAIEKGIDIAGIGADKMEKWAMTFLARETTDAQQYAEYFRRLKDKYLEFKLGANASSISGAFELANAVLGFVDYGVATANGQVGILPDPLGLGGWVKKMSEEDDAFIMEANLKRAIREHKVSGFGRTLTSMSRRGNNFLKDHSATYVSTSELINIINTGKIDLEQLKYKSYDWTDNYPTKDGVEYNHFIIFKENSFLLITVQK